ncbi:hypothetical protein ACWDWO_16790 [Actinopolymorpha singaporensis]|uniref:Excreted virulence factor EspC, type VII ESX diderm n=1 Tax=Actinopolymorpha singaporensis TaxID=117157 RepID=A0A1H1RRZ4_9ACTN|nr:hypothetical protein [Actinopolymorpha singaporensis]SDS37799.1 hypothetical protein SAMN04489717_2501 [Actinopolymorpha singaporensis]
MSDERRNDPEALRNGGKDLMRIGDDGHAAWAALKRRSEGMGDIFGDDMVGGLIGMAYGAVFALADESFTGSHDDIIEFGERLKYAGDNDERTEQGNAEALSDLDGTLDGVEV